MRTIAQVNENAISGAVKVDGKEIQNHLSYRFRKSVEETLNKFLNAEADALCGASRYQRSPERQDTRAGSYSRKLMTRVGEVDLTIPRLRTLPFETQIIERYKRRGRGACENVPGRSLRAQGGRYHRNAVGVLASIKAT